MKYFHSEALRRHSEAVRELMRARKVPLDNPLWRRADEARMEIDRAVRDDDYNLAVHAASELVAIGDQLRMARPVVQPPPTRLSPETIAAIEQKRKERLDQWHREQAERWNRERERDQ